MRYKEILQFCRDYYQEHKQFPLLREIGEEFGITKEASRQNLSRLVEKGYLAKSGWKKRGYTFLVKDIYKKDDEEDTNLLNKIIKKIRKYG